MSLLQDSTNSPVKPLPTPLKNKKSTVFTVPIEHTINMKAMIITDQNFGKTLPLTKSIPHCMKSLMTIIARESINCIFMIGDLVYINEKDPKIEQAKEILSKVFKALEMIPIPVYILGGERNRRLLYDVNYDVPHSNIHVVYDFLIRIHNPNPPIGTPSNFYLTHDCKNPLVLKANEIESYAIELKRALQDEISNEDYLIIGHCQAYYQNDTAKVASIKEYSPDLHRNGYAVLKLTPEGFNLNIVGK